MAGVTGEVHVAMIDTDPPAAGQAAPEQKVTLSSQDAELLRLIGSGLPLDAVARRLNTSERTVRRRVRAICGRLGVTSSIQAVVWAARQGLA
jgi:DNA-binding NarL/FixJ family response regulator